MILSAHFKNHGFFNQSREGPLNGLRIHIHSFRTQARHVTPLTEPEALVLGMVDAESQSGTKGMVPSTDPAPGGIEVTEPKGKGSAL
jgi:hypothetical protein